MMDGCRVFTLDSLHSVIHCNLLPSLHKDQRLYYYHHHSFLHCLFAIFFIFQQVNMFPFRKQFCQFPVITCHTYLISLSTSKNDWDIMLEIKEILCFNHNFLEKAKFGRTSELFQNIWSLPKWVVFISYL